MPATSPLILVRLHGEYGTNQGKAYEAPTICREYEPLTAVIRLSVSVGLFFLRERMASATFYNVPSYEPNDPISVCYRRTDNAA